jgi:thymidylate kinase
MDPMPNTPTKSSLKIVSFSGIDGAGKTTQLIEFESWLRHFGLRTKLLTFWDDVVVLAGLREYISRRAFKGDSGVGSPEKPLQRRDKNVTAWPVTALRFFLYSADAVNLYWTVRSARKSNVDVVVFDRYIYDEFANLPLDNLFSRAFVRLAGKLVPRPDVAFVIDADPVAAFARKPEYPLEFIHRNRHAYLALARLIGDITIVEPASTDATGMRIKQVMLDNLSTAEAYLSEVPLLQ